MSLLGSDLSHETRPGSLQLQNTGRIRKTWLGKGNSLALFATGLNAEIGEVDEEKIGKGVHYFSSIWGRVVILWTELLVESMKGTLLHTSSHQLMVEVTGSQ